MVGNILVWKLEVLPPLRTACREQKCEAVQQNIKKNLGCVACCWRHLKEQALKRAWEKWEKKKSSK